MKERSQESSMPRPFPQVLIAIVSALALLVVGQTSGRIASVRASNCAIDGIVVRLSDFEPASGVTLLLLGGGGSATTDTSGEFSLPVGPSSRTTLRVVTSTDVIVATYTDYFVVEQGAADITFQVSSLCRFATVDFAQTSRVEGPVSRPNPPALPDGYKPSQETLDAKVPTASMGNAGNVPWIGYFWLTAPVVTVGVCDIFDYNTNIAVESAINRWETAANLGWKIVRNNDACKPDFPQPKLLIKREAVGRSRLVLGSTPATDMDGKECKVDLAGTICWVGTVTIKLNPAGFDRLSSTQQIATVLHEMGHAFGLAHTRGCGDSIMWYNTRRCESSPSLSPGNDDIASANDLLSETLRRLRPEAPMPPPMP
jgi:hypothetical protein